MTVGELKVALKDVPDDFPICVSGCDGDGEYYDDTETTITMLSDGVLLKGSYN